MKNEMTIKIIEDISKQHDAPAEQRAFDKAIAALRYCEEHGLTYYVEGKYFDKNEEMWQWIVRFIGHKKGDTITGIA